ncbi:hypothetical protein CLOM_g9516 [Closterium sp. NIES-68]|nr:hypothetical protein CLOM_g9516 [Closterium sp. NIES-68]GJP69555.1 hypothetical protein CLOP_g556 [Closterium sp. NIES-67]
MKRRGGNRRAAIAVLALLLLGLSTCRSQPGDALTGQPAALSVEAESVETSSGGNGGSGGSGGDPYSDDWEDPIPGDHPSGDDTIVDTSDDVEADDPPGNAAVRGVIPGDRKPGDLVPGEEDGVDGGAEAGGAETWEAQEEAAEEEPENPWAEPGRAEGSSAAVAQAQDYQPGEGKGFAEGPSGKGRAEEEPGTDWPTGEAGESAEEEVGDESGRATAQEATNADGGTGGTDERNFRAQGDGEAEQPAQGDAWSFAEDQPADGAEQGGEMGDQGGQGEGEGEGGAGAETGDNSEYFFHGQDPEADEWQKRKHGWQDEDSGSGSNDANDANDANQANDSNESSDYNEAEQTQTSGSPTDASPTDANPTEGNPGEGDPNAELFSDNNPFYQDTAAAKMADAATTEPDSGAGSEGSVPATPASGSFSEGYEKMAGGKIGAEGIIGIVLGVTLGAGLCLLVVCVCWVRQRNINRAKESEAMAAYADDNSEDEDEEGLEEAAETALMGGIVGTHRALDIEAQQALKSSKR